MRKTKADTTSNKHAYLIMCHTNFDQLMRLLELLDDERNDIYLHIDKKATGELGRGFADQSGDQVIEGSDQNISQLLSFVVRYGSSAENAG